MDDPLATIVPSSAVLGGNPEEAGRVEAGVIDGVRWQSVSIGVHAHRRRAKRKGVERLGVRKG